MKPFHRNGDKSQPWVIRYRQQVNENGTIKTVHRKLTLCPATVPKAEAYKIAERELAKLEASRPASSALVLGLGEYFSRVFLQGLSTLRAKYPAPLDG